MNPPISIRNQACPNARCARAEEVLAGNVVINGRKRPRLKCKTCGTTWAAHRQEIHYGLRTPSETVKGALEMLAQGLSIRRIARRLKVSPSAVQRWKKRYQKIIS